MRMCASAVYRSGVMALPSIQLPGQRDASNPGEPYENHMSAASSAVRPLAAERGCLGYDPAPGVAIEGLPHHAACPSTSNQLVKKES